MNTEKEFNFIYEKLVADENDITGHIAYSIYKSKKIEYIKSQVENDIEITNDVLKPFNEISSLETSINDYKLNAELILKGFTENINDVTQQEIYDYVKTNQEEILSEIIAPYKPNFWRRVLSGVVSAFIFALLLTIFAIILDYRNYRFNFQIIKENVEQLEKHIDTK